MDTYDARVYREGKWWMVEVPAIDGLTNTRRFSEVELMARELIAVTLNVPLSQVAVRIDSIAVGRDIAKDIANVQHARQRAAEAETAANQQTKALAEELVRADVPLRDVGAVVGLSYQRIHQLVS